LPFYVTLFYSRQVKKVFGRAIFSKTKDVYNNMLLFVKRKLKFVKKIFEKNF